MVKDLDGRDIGERSDAVFDGYARHDDGEDVDRG
jgi:hypothetical protein